MPKKKKRNDDWTLMLYTTALGPMMCGPKLWPPQPVTDPWLLEILFGDEKSTGSPRNSAGTDLPGTQFPF
jgi:hypothetical protein